MRCKAHNVNGDQCKAGAIHGAVVCRMHGGGAPQVKAAARARLEALVHPALARLGKLVDDDLSSVALGACKDVLDRTGFKPTDQVELSGTVETLVTIGFHEILPNG